MTNTNVSIRPANAEDAKQIQKLRKRVDRDRKNKNPPLDPYGGDYPSLEQQVSEIQTYLDQGAFLVAVSGEEIVGFALCFQLYGLPGHYRIKFIVDHPWRKQGIGTRLVMEMVEWGQVHSQVLELVCSFHRSYRFVEKLLKRFGFQVTRQGLVPFMYGGTFNATEMTLDLRPKA